MNWLWRMGIGTRLGAASIGFIMLLAALCTVSVLNARSLASALNATVHVGLVRVDMANGLMYDAGLVARASRELLLVDGAGQIKKQRELIATASATSDSRFAKLAELPGSPEMAELTVKVRDSREAFVKATAAYLVTLESGNPDDARSTLLIGLRPVQAAYEQSLQALAARSMKQAETRAAEGESSANANATQMLALGALGLSLGVAAAIALTRSITKPLRVATEAARRIQRGDLSTPIQAFTQDEIGTLLAAMGTMQSHLTHVIEDVHRTAKDVSTGSDEIARGNADLSARTERASTNLMQTASAMQQISATAAGSSAKSRQASAVAGKARSAVIDGGQVVEGLVGTMSRIAQSSARIKDIIAVIDGIAFQTNILALNAAVEAARAGEQGRGFAVVASEVRSLAQRTAEAAKEIKGLIEDSVEKVGVGTRTVAEVGERIRSIVTEVVGVREMIEEIASSSEQQEAGIGSINSSVTELDHSTQQNAAMVDELSATTGSLSANARKLVAAVEFFSHIPRAQAA